MLLRLFLIPFFLFLLSAPLSAHGVSTKLRCALDGERLACALFVTLPDGYHAYSNETRDIGRPTECELTVNNESLTIIYPKGAAQRDFYAPDHSIFVYEDEFPLFTQLPAEAAGAHYTGSLSLLLCSEHNCIPVNLSLKGTIPRTLPELSKEPWAVQFSEAIDTKPKESAHPVPKPETPAPLPPPDSFAVTLDPVYADKSLEITTLSKAMLFGLLAGLILNIMPCVLPVLTFKMSGLLLIGAQSESERIRLFRRHNLCFSAGILTFFTLLALILGLADFIWGQLFQNQTLVLLMLCFVFLMGLSMLEVFSLPVIDLKLSDSTKSPYLNAYFTGLMTTFLATPCSGPLLGGVLGWAFTQPLAVLMLIFWFIGLGMALPYLLFSLWPRAVLLLPKSGPWMNVVEHIVGYFLLGTAIYLLSILPQEMYIHILATLLFIAVAASVWGKYCRNGASPLRKRLLGILCIAIFTGSIVSLLTPQARPLAWQTFTPELFTSNLGKRMILVQFTADWCPNCKFLEKTVLTDETMQSLLDKHDFLMMKADLTQANAAATYLLTTLGSRSIPLTAIFPPGEKSRKPIVLRDIYDTAWLKKNFARAIEEQYSENGTNVALEKRQHIPESATP
ncbi:MAG: thioredoxin family protein [Desulfovibrio sp.]|nr:thioredoxin family protein [Desulfovibrio sp.]